MAYVGEIARRDLGEEHGQALNEALGQFANYKFQEMMKRNDRNRLKETYGQLGQTILSPEENEAFSNILANTPQEEHSALMQVLPQLFAMKRQQSQQQPSSQPSGFQKFMGQIGQPSGVAQIPQQQQQPITQPTNAQQPVDSMQLLSRAFESPAIRFQREKETGKERRFAQTQDVAQEKLENLKRPYIDKIADTLKKNREQLQAYNEMENLVKRHETDTPKWMSVLKLAGLEDYPFLTKPGSQEYNAKMLMFTPKIKEDFGARPTQWDAQQIFNRLATLYHSDEGKLRILKAGRKQVEARNLIEQEKQAIIKENRGKIPADISLQADERAQKKISQLYEAYKKDVGINIDWNNPELNPSKYKDGTVLEIEGRDYKLINGEWV